MKAMLLLHRTWVLTASLATLHGCVADPKIGECNMTYFITGGFSCQRKMVSDLKHKPNANCSVEYQDQTSCLVDHLKSCLTGLFAGFVPAVTSLIKLLLYHCGDLKVDPALIDQFLLNQIQCKGSVFAQTVECWNDFRERLNRDKTDPKLCSDYAVAKECVTREAKTGCAIGQYVNRDLFNPFCTYNTDPPLNSSEPSIYIGSCTTQTFATQEYNNLKLCLSATTDSCLTNTALSPFKDEVQRLVRTLLYHCGDLRGNELSISPFLLEALNCNKSMFETSVGCWDQFRLRLILNNEDRQLCVDYARSKQCISMAVQNGCAIGDLMEDDLYNPFCVDGIDPLALPSASALISGRFTFVCGNDFFYRKGIECEDHFLTAIYSAEGDANCGRQSESFLRCLKENFEPCIEPSPNSILLESLSIVVLQSLQGTQLLCDSSVYQIAWDDLPPLLRKVATCDNDYSAVVADCGRTFRSKFIPVPSPLCEEFENGKSCIDEARQTHCSFDVQTLRTLKGNINPFCDNRTRPLFRDVGSCQSINQKLAFAVLIFSVMSCVSCR
ncbi:hypothetical protein pdam_00003817 [Pocillopora damicornis]|uniref:DUF19 domain-containing protein n=1 Tax=Pocillopora damicornis TaxID=46731 RepID=A0A3M6T4L7_POCDA|nr:hypothetical protein pdam_00003817 [Pocillopora damicornis]